LEIIEDVKDDADIGWIIDQLKKELEEK